MLGLILQRLHPNLNRKHMVCVIYIMHMYVLLGNGLTVISCAVNGKGGMFLTLPLTTALSKKNTHLAWFTTTRPLNKYKRTRTQHSAENGMVGLILQRLHPDLNHKHLVCSVFIMHTRRVVSSLQPSVLMTVVLLTQILNHM